MYAFNSKTDGRFLKSIVGTVWYESSPFTTISPLITVFRILESFQTAFEVHAAYAYTITDFGRSTELGVILWCAFNDFI